MNTKFASHSSSLHYCCCMEVLAVLTHMLHTLFGLKTFSSHQRKVLPELNIFTLRAHYISTFSCFCETAFSFGNLFVNLEVILCPENEHMYQISCSSLPFMTRKKDTKKVMYKNFDITRKVFV